MANSQTITALYDNGVLTPLEKVRLKKRQKVRVKITPIGERKKKVVAPLTVPTKPTEDELVKQRIKEAFGMWADRDDIGDDWLDEIRAGWEERMKRIYEDA